MRKCIFKGLSMETVVLNKPFYFYVTVKNGDSQMERTLLFSGRLLNPVQQKR